MKRILCFAALSALVLASCAKTEPIGMTDADNEAIEFRTYNAQATRGTVATTATLQKVGTNFGVFAYYTQQTAWAEVTAANRLPNYMYNQKIEPVWTADAEPAFSNWHYNPMKYWPNTIGDKISFFAYAPYATANNGIAIPAYTSETSYPVIPFTVASPNAGNMVDLLYASDASLKDVVKRTTPVTFTFNHALSRVIFYAKINKDLYGTNGATQTSDGVTQVIIKSIVIDGTSEAFWKSGKMSLKDGSWSGATGDLVAFGADYDLKDILLTQAPESAIVNTATSYVYKDAASNSIVSPLPVSGAEQNLFKTNATNGQEYLFLIPADYMTAADDAISPDNGIGDENDLKVKITYDIVTVDTALPNKYSIATTTETVSLPNGTLQAGKAYKYTFTIGLENIQVEGVVTDWGAEEEIAAPSVTLGENEETFQMLMRLNAMKAADPNCNYFTSYIKETGTLPDQNITAVAHWEAFEFVEGDIIDFQFVEGATFTITNVNPYLKLSFDNGTTWVGLIDTATPYTYTYSATTPNILVKKCANNPAAFLEEGETTAEFLGRIDALRVANPTCYYYIAGINQTTIPNQIIADDAVLALMPNLPLGLVAFKFIQPVSFTITNYDPDIWITTDLKQPWVQGTTAGTVINVTNASTVWGVSHRTNP